MYYDKLLLVFILLFCLLGIIVFSIIAGYEIAYLDYKKGYWPFNKKDK